MDRTGACGLPRTRARVALIIAAFLLLTPAFGQAASVRLEWDRNSDGITAGYFVYYGTESGKYSGTVDVGTSTSAVVNLNDPNATYYFAVQAYSATGEKSPLSTEVLWSQSGTTPTGGTPTGGTPTGGTPTGDTPSVLSPTLRNPGSMTTVVGQSVNLQLSASDPGGLFLTYSAAGLPSGVALGTATGVISGIPSTPGAYLVIITVTNTSRLSASQTFTWTILTQPASSGSPGGVPGGIIGGVPGGTGGGGTVGGVPGGTGGGGTGGGVPGGTGGGGTGGGGTGTGGGTPESQTPVPTQDLTPPTVIVSSPAQAGASWRTTDSKVIVMGSASDNVGVISITWANSRGGSGAAFGTSSWATSPIDLSMGDNVITITAADAAGNVRTATLTVTRYVDIQNFVN
jgi:Putative Ig domain/Fibronectin type III domain